jgi:hypothetical protein
MCSIIHIEDVGVGQLAFLEPLHEGAGYVVLWLPRRIANAEAFPHDQHLLLCDALRGLFLSVNAETQGRA